MSNKVLEGLQYQPTLIGLSGFFFKLATLITPLLDSRAVFSPPSVVETVASGICLHPTYIVLPAVYLLHCALCMNAVCLPFCFSGIFHR